MFDSLITKVQQKIHHWSAKLLSYACKVQLINDVLFGLENFWCTSALQPKEVIKKLNRLCKDYFWGIVDGGRKLVFKKWSQICAPWNRGGFNIKNVEIWNISLLIQWIWKLSTNSAGFKGMLAARDKFLLKAGSVHTAMGLLNSWVAAPVQTAFYSALIHPRVVPGHKIIALLAAQGKLGTMDNLQYRGFSLANRCCLCQMAEETHHHIFFNCVFSGTVWQNLLDWLRIHRHGLQLLDELQWIVQYGTNKGWRTALFKTTIAAAVYELWRERNGRIFSHHERTVKGVVDRVKYIVTVRMLMFPQHAHSQFVLDSLRN
ncbi:uncharacterized protein LOC141641380 [Silene latifolia]|uniref:uncharacterized protein LOC141641380 n=1 Tax=Silene latifolia TaxID=37657 RepID=UPI003D77B993